MGLTFPLNTSQTGRNVSQDNLATLLCSKNTGEDVTSVVARSAFEDYQNARLSIGHYAKKFTVCVAAYGTTIGLPVSAVIGATYWLLKDYISRPSQALSDLAAAVYNNSPAFSENIPIIGRFAPYTTPLFCLGTLGALAAVDKAFKEQYGVAPSKSVAKWSINMVSTVLLYAAYKAGELASSTYLEEELEKGESRKFSHQRIFEHLKCIYDDVAQGFFSDYEKSLNSPKEMMKFKHMAEQLEENFPYIKSQLAGLDLKKFEIDQIMDKLSTTTTTIKDFALGFRQTGTEADEHYNTELLKTLTKRDIASIAIPNEVKNHLKVAQYNDLGAMHTLKSFVAAGAMGVAAAAIVELAIPTIFAAGVHLAGFDTGCKPSLIFSGCPLETAVAGLAIIPALDQGAKYASKVYDDYCEERLNADARKIEQAALAHEKLLIIYNGIAVHLSKKYIEAKYDRVALKQLSEDAKNILAKLSLIEAEIATVSVMENRNEIIENLRHTLVSLV